MKIENTKEQRKDRDREEMGEVQAEYRLSTIFNTTAIPI